MFRARPRRSPWPSVARNSAEFRRQSHEFHRLRTERGLPGRHVEVPGCNHFTVLTALADRQGGLAAEVAA